MVDNDDRVVRIGIGGPVGSFSLGGLVTAVIGALVILAVFRAVSK